MRTVMSLPRIGTKFQSEVLGSVEYRTQDRDKSQSDRQTRGERMSFRHAD